MDTKWKNIKGITVELKKERILERIKKENLVRLMGAVFGVCAGAFLLWTLWDEVQSLISREAWIRGVCINLFLMAGFWNGGVWLINRAGGKWQKNAEQFYQEWKGHWKRQQILMGTVFAAAELPALLAFRRLEHTWYIRNYSVGYVTIVTVCIQFIVLEAAVISGMLRILGIHMEAREEINRSNVEKAVRSEMMKVDLISNVSHDLKTPLTSMVGYIELMKKEELSPVMEDYVQVLSNKAQKLKEMIDSLFDLAKTSSGNVELKMEHLELNRLVEQVQADMEDRILESGKELVTALAGEDTGFISDSGYAYRICQNLIENALKYSADNTRIFIKTRTEERRGKQMVVFEITNTAGYRMDFTEEQIVERFARGDEARTTDGNGLGLAIVSTYTSALGGEFKVSIDCDQFKAVTAFPQLAK